MKLWLVYFESANYIGCGEYCVVTADSEDAAREAAIGYAEEFYYEQDACQWEDDNEGCENEGPWASIVYVVEFNESHELWKHYIDPKQTRFYPKLN